MRPIQLGPIPPVLALPTPHPPGGGGGSRIQKQVSDSEEKNTSVTPPPRGMGGWGVATLKQLSGAAHV